MLETISLLFYNIKKPFLNSLQFATHQLGIRVSLILIKMFVHQNGISNWNAFTAKYDVQWPRTPPRLGFWDPFSELLRTTKASLSAVLSLYLHTVPGDLKYVHLRELNFGESRGSKNAIFTIFGPLNLISFNLVNFRFKKMQKSI